MLPVTPPPWRRYKQEVPARSKKPKFLPIGTSGTLLICHYQIHVPNGSKFRWFNFQLMRNGGSFERGNTNL